MADRDLGVRSAGSSSGGSRRSAALPTFTSGRPGTAVKSVPKQTSLDRALKGESMSSGSVERTYSKRETTVSSSSRERRGWFQNAAQAQHAVRMLDHRMKTGVHDSLRSTLDHEGDTDPHRFSSESFAALSNPVHATGTNQMSSSVLSGSMRSSAARELSEDTQMTPIYTSDMIGLGGVERFSGHSLSLDLRTGIPATFDGENSAQNRDVPESVDSQGRESSSTPVRTWEEFQQVEAAAAAAESRRERISYDGKDGDVAPENAENEEPRLHDKRERTTHALETKVRMLSGKVRSLESQLEVQRQTSAKLASMCRANQKEHEQALQRAFEQHNTEYQKIHESEAQLIKRIQQMEAAERKASKRKNEPWREESLENEYFRLKEKLSEMQGKISKETLRAVKAEMQLEKHAVDHRAAMQKMKEAQITLSHAVEDKESLLYAMQQESGTCSNTLENLREYCRKLEAEKLSVRTALHDKEDQNESLRRKAAEGEAEIERMRKHIVRLQEVGADLEDKGQENALRVETLEADNKRLQSLVAELDGAKARARRQVEEQAKSAALLQTQHETVVAQYSELEEALRSVHERQAADHVGTLDKIQAQYAAKLRTQQQELLQRLADKEAAIVELEGERERLQHSHTLLKQAQDTAAHDHLQTTTALEKSLEALHALRDSVTMLTEEKAALAEEAGQRERRAAEEVERLLKEHAAERLKLRRELEEDKEGLRRALAAEQETLRRTAAEATEALQRGWEGEKAQLREAGQEAVAKVLERRAAEEQLQRTASEGLAAEVGELRRAAGEAGEARARLEARVAELRDELAQLRHTREREREAERERSADREELSGVAEGLVRELEGLRGQLAAREGELAGARLELVAVQARLESSEARAEGAEKRAREAEGAKAAVEVSLLALGEEVSAASAEAREAQAQRRHAEAQAAALEQSLKLEAEARAKAEEGALEAAGRGTPARERPEGRGQEGRPRPDAAEHEETSGRERWAGGEGGDGRRERRRRGDEDVGKGGGREGEGEAGWEKEGGQVGALRRYVELLEERLARAPPPHPHSPPPHPRPRPHPPSPHTSHGASPHVAALEARIAQYEAESREWEALRAELCCKVALLEGKATRATASEEEEAVQVRKLQILAAQRAEECGALRERALALEMEAAQRRQEAEKLRKEVEKLRARSMELEDEVVRRQLEVERCSRQRASDSRDLRRAQSEAEAAQRRAEQLAQEAEAERKRAGALAAELNTARLKHWLALPNPEAAALPRPPLELSAERGRGEESEEVHALVGLVEKLLRERPAPDTRLPPPARRTPPPAGAGAGTGAGGAGGGAAVLSSAISVP